MAMNTLRLIAGSGRSGTTWLLDSIAEANNLRPIFEPLHPDSSVIAQKFSYAYLTQENAHDDLRLFFEEITDNQFKSVWTSYRINPKRLRLDPKRFRSASQLKGLLRKWSLLANRYWTYRARERRSDSVVKCIRANLMLDWIQANTNAQTVLLMRHPCAVVESQLRFPEVWDPYWLLEKYRNDSALMDGPLRELHAVIERDFTQAQALTAIWCIENLVPALQAKANSYQVVFYEELLEHPDTEWKRVATGLGLEAIPAARLLTRPSQQSAVRLQKQGSDDSGYVRSYASWRQRLAASDIDAIAAVLHAFGIEFYTVAQSRPIIESFKRQFLLA
jgi:hypothetical protein